MTIRSSPLRRTLLIAVMLAINPVSRTAAQTVANVGVTMLRTTGVAGDSAQASCIVRSSTSIISRSCLWQSSNPSVIAVGPSSGMVRWLQPGTVDLIARSGAGVGSRGGILIIRDTARVAPPALIVSSISVTASATALLPGATTQAIAIVRDQNGQAMQGQPLTWTSSAVAVASVGQTGLIVANAAGAAIISATAANAVHGDLPITVSALPPIPVDTLPPPNPASGAPDPTKLPIAPKNPVWNLAAYQALGLPSKAAGFVYTEPTTGIQMQKLTSASFPASGSNWGMPYNEGGTVLSLPYKADGTRAFLAFGTGGSAQQRIVDVLPLVSVSNARSFQNGASPSRDLCFAFSSNAATPYYAYVLNGSALVRIDIRTMAAAPGEGFPVSGAGDGGWLQNSENDGQFVWLTGSTVHLYTRATAQHITRDISGINEPRFSRAGRYVGASMNNNNGLVMWDSQLNTTWAQGGEAYPFSHNATLKDLWIGSAWNGNYPFPFTSTGVTAGSARNEWGPSVGPGAMGNGAWNQAGDPRSAWSVWNSHASGIGGHDGWPQTWTAPGGIVLATMTGGAANARLVAFAFSTQSGGYWGDAWPQLTSDGGAVIFASDMGGGRWDLFAAWMPRQQ